MRQALLLSVLPSWGNWGTEITQDLVKVTQPVCGKTGVLGSRACSLNHLFVAVIWSLSGLNSLRPHGLYSTRLLCPWNFPSKNAELGCHFLLQGIFPTQGLNPRLLHCRQILYHLGHPGSPDHLCSVTLSVPLGHMFLSVLYGKQPQQYNIHWPDTVPSPFLYGFVQSSQQP